MRSCPLLFLLLLLFTLLPLGQALAQPPPEFALEQNDPNPFCGETTISFALPQLVHVSLSVWNPDSTDVVRTLIVGNLRPGYHIIIWDGHDENGSQLPDGSYPYVLIAAEAPGDPPLFVGSHRASIACATPVETWTWGEIKAGYRRPTP